MCRITGDVKKGALHLRQLASNEPKILENFDKSDLDKSFALDPDAPIKMLGLSWKAFNDKFIYKINSNRVNNGLTKRILLSEIARIFDPLGLLGQIILYAASMIQEFWTLKIRWDDKLPAAVSAKWFKFYIELHNIKKVSFPRFIFYS